MSDPFVGEIRMFAGNFEPVDWAFCDGRLLSISANDALFALIGTTYGGDGQTNFALPDLRGRLPVGQGSGPGLTPRAMGEQFGTDAVTLTEQQLPSHHHNFSATTAAAATASPSGGLFGDTENDVLYVSSPGSPELKTMGTDTVAGTGENQPHNNIMSSTAMHYIICLVGIFPSQS